jgi:hypothetical protein
MLRVVALVDPDVERAKAVLKAKENSHHFKSYSDTQIYVSIPSAAESLPLHLYPE